MFVISKSILMKKLQNSQQPQLVHITQGDVRHPGSSQCYQGQVKFIIAQDETNNKLCKKTFIKSNHKVYIEKIIKCTLYSVLDSHNY